MEEFHKKVLNHFRKEDSVFLIRKVKNQQRGLIYRNDQGNLLKPTDNSPSWWLHYHLFHDKLNEFSDFSEFIGSIPSHMFDIKIKEHVSHAGWHVAHIFNTNDYKTNFSEWDENELLQRTLRNIHPCNYFYIPKSNWREYGSDCRVISYIYDKFKKKYSSIFSEFESIVNPEKKLFEVPTSKISIDTFETKKNIETNNEVTTSLGDKNKEKLFTRLTFKSSEIEPLSDNDLFELHTIEGTFRMTKKDFYTTFKNVRESKSYKINGLYHYPKTPKKAFQYLI